LEGIPVNPTADYLTGEFGNDSNSRGCRPCWLCSSVRREFIPQTVGSNGYELEHELERVEDLGVIDVRIHRLNWWKTNCLQYRLGSHSIVHKANIWEDTRAVEDGCSNMEVSSEEPDSGHTKNVVSDGDKDNRWMVESGDEGRLHVISESIPDDMSSTAHSPISGFNGIIDLVQITTVLCKNIRRKGIGDKCVSPRLVK